MARVASGRLTSILMIPICNCIPHVLRYVFMTQPLGHGIFAGTQQGAAEEQKLKEKKKQLGYE